MKRIHQRGRALGSSIASDYLSLLDSSYNHWNTNFDICSVLTLKTDDLDFVHQSRHLDTVVERINEKLAGKEEMTF
jgi:deoxyadenosine/deoxycytidine kinase